MHPLSLLLKNEPVFGQLPDGQRPELTRAGIDRSYDKDEAIARQGDEWPHVLLVMEGGLRSVIVAPDGRSFVGSTWESGDVFWSPTVFDGGPMAATLEATAPTKVRIWEGEDALRLVIRHEQAMRALLRKQAAIIRQRRQGIYNLAFNPLLSRLAQLLLDKIFVSGEATVQRELTLEDMAQMLASSPEVVCRLLYSFQTMGTISVSRASITLHDRDALEGLAARE